MISINDIESAQSVLKGHAYKTPLMQNHILDELTGAKVFIKPENLQKTGSFKFRGAFNAISRLSEVQKKAGVVASSSGNHAQGIAQAAHQLGVAATIVMPDDAPQLKIERTKRSGAKVITYNRVSEDRDAIAKAQCAKNGASFIHPFNNGDVIAGQGTVGLEIVQQLRELQTCEPKLDRVLVCTGGGGLTAGVAVAVSHYFPKAKIHSVEPEGFDDYRRSLISGNIEENSKLSGSICDAIISPSPGDIGFALNKPRLSEGLVVTDDDALDAVRFAFNELKLIVEPGGAVALAALLISGNQYAGETIACIISGGNIDPAFMANILAN